MGPSVINTNQIILSISQSCDGPKLSDDDDDGGKDEPKCKANLTTERQTAGINFPVHFKKFETLFMRE